MGDGDIISAGISAGEIEIDEAGDAPIQHQHIIGKQIGMDDAAREVFGPMCLQERAFRRHPRLQARLDLIKIIAAPLGQIIPTLWAKRIGAIKREVGQCLVKLTQGLAR